MNLTIYKKLLTVNDNLLLFPGQPLVVASVLYRVTTKECYMLVFNDLFSPVSSEYNRDIKDTFCGYDEKMTPTIRQKSLTTVHFQML